ncbi:MAG: hypothetical protein PHF33_05135 [Candidatus Delongbacteria bacterium]|nr:hypothetical protein [Candidatus Delongbacteria bacterium]
MNKKKLIIIYVMFIVIEYLYSYSTPDLIPNENEKYFLNPLLNYQNLLYDGSIRDSCTQLPMYLNLCYGSLTSSQLYKFEDIQLNLNINDKYSFLMHYLENENRHRPFNVYLSEFGFITNFSNDFKFLISSELDFEKKNIDMNFGLIFTRNSNYYLLLKYKCEDVIYDEKSSDETKTIKRPFIFKAELFIKRNNFSIYNNIDLFTPMERKFYFNIIDNNKKKMFENTTSMKYQINNRIDIKCLFNYSYFYESVIYRDLVLSDYIVDDLYMSFDTAIHYSISSKFKSIVGNIYAYEYKKYYSSDYFKYKIGANNPYIFFNYLKNNFIFTIGYFSQILFKDEIRKNSSIDKIIVNPYIDLIKLGILYKLSQNSSVYMSISHSISDDCYGGGNVKFAYTF